MQSRLERKGKTVFICKWDSIYVENPMESTKKKKNRIINEHKEIEESKINI